MGDDLKDLYRGTYAPDLLITALERNLDKVQALTMNMLTYSKARKPTRELTNLPYLLNECLELAKSAAADKGVTLLPEISMTQPPSPVLVTSDSGWLGYSRLLVAMRPGRSRVMVRCTARMAMAMKAICSGMAMLRKEGAFWSKPNRPRPSKTSPARLTAQTPMVSIARRR